MTTVGAQRSRRRCSNNTRLSGSDMHLGGRQPPANSGRFMDHLLPVQLVELQNVAADLAETVIAPLAAAGDADCRWPAHSLRALDRKSVVEGTRVSVRVNLGGRRLIQK